jgi:lysophospholipase L1-like esterase
MDATEMTTVMCERVRCHVRALLSAALALCLLCGLQACADQSTLSGSQDEAGAGPTQAGQMSVSAAGSVSDEAGRSGQAGAAAHDDAGSLAPARAGQSGSSGVGSVATRAGAGGSGAVAGAINAAGAGGASGASEAGRGGAGSAATAGKATVYIAGDSTVQTYTSGDLEGWGQELGQFFDARISIVNKAIGGRSVAFFMYAVEMDASGGYVCSDNQGTPKFRLDANGKRIDTSQWSQIKSGMKAGDFLLIQFGHNDETHDCPRYVSTTDFETELGNMADAARAKGSTPIFVTPMGHRSFSGMMVRNTLLPYANAMKDEASQKKVEVVDLNLRSVEYYMMVGDAYLAANIFDGGTTHFHKQGAIEMAKLIVGELRKSAGPLAAYLK